MVTKRDGRKVEFDGNKIKMAILKAINDAHPAYGMTEPPYLQPLIDEFKDMNEAYDLNIEDIQDHIEEYLMNVDKPTARSYIRYRYKREAVRKYKNDFLFNLKEKIEATNVQNQNANVDEKSFGGRKGETDSEVMRQYALEYCISPKFRDNHLNNRIYIHDLDSYAVGMHNCLSIPFDDLLANGFNTRQTDVRPANSINTAFQLIAVIFQLQSLQQFGGVSATHLDWTMVPYVRKSFYKHYKDGLQYVEKLSAIDIDKQTSLAATIKPEDLSIEDDVAWSYNDAYTYALEMTKRELDQAVEGMYHNLK